LPKLALIGSPFTLEGIIAMFRVLTGREPDPEDVRKAERILANRAGKP
jgi:hypothetical protein